MTKIFSALAVLATLLAPVRSSTAVTTAEAPAGAPRLIILLRHAEKSPDEKDPDLTPAGRARAEKLPELFVSTPTHPARFAHPDVLFATAPSKKSNRPAETIAPLGRALSEKVNLSFDRDDDAGLSREIMSGKYAGRVVLVIWHHKTIPMLAHDFGVTDPPKWHDDTYDQVWEIDFNDGTAHLTTAPQNLMPGDAKQ